MSLRWEKDAKGPPPDYDEAISSAPAIATQAEAVVPEKDHDTRFAMITFEGLYHIKLIRFSESVKNIICGVLQELYAQGTENTWTFDEGIAIRLQHTPYAFDTDDDKVAICVSLMGILASLSKEGWHIMPAGGRVARIGSYEKLDVNSM